ncbi:putative tetratricopeptide repeat protein 41 isoform X1 [Chiloscyllium punctatum]|uniref:putative tetratricopeptide repeat protein 41 isoform X1 n=1 Tax=Chiloscyllium punctatum TaxID=137246 RepID=UPI003B6352D5
MSKCLKNRTICGRRQYECHGSPCHSLPCYADWRYRPPIQVVLCSTTEDFQEERDYLEHHVFPFLNKLCKSRRSSLKVLDMQWTSHEGHHRANTDSHKLKVSLDLITKISPFFICMLGQKYGEYCPPDMEHFPASGTDAETLSSVERNIQIAARNGYSWILHENYQNCSLLELQIIEAALMNDSGFSFFYFRDSRYVEDLLLNAAPDETEMIEHKYKSKDEHEKQMIMKLKEKIVNEGIPVESFRTIEELGDVIMRNCCDVIDKLYPMDLVPLQTDRESYLEMCYHQASLQRHCQGFVETKEMKEIFGILNKFAVSFLKNEAIGELPKSGCPFLFNKMAPSRLKPVPKGKSVLLLCGEKGCGKSTVICNWLKYFTQTNPSILVINHFVGSSSASYDIMSFMRHCILKLRHEYFGAEDHPDTFSENPADLWVFQMIHKAFIAAISLKPCLLVLDGVDQLTGSRGMSAQQVKKFSWLPWPLPDQCRLIVTTASSSLSYKSLLRHKEVHMVQFFNKITDKVRSHIFHQHLAMPYKEINENQIQNILSRKLSSLPLVLVILANELRVCGAFRNETDCLEEYLQCRSVQDLWAAVFKRWIEDYSWVTEKRTCNREKEISYSCAHSSISGMKGWVVDILCLLSVSRYGLNEEDIQQLLKDLGYKDTNEISSFDWALFRTATMAWIQERPDGLLNFTHQSIRDAVEYLLLGVIAPVNESTSNSYQNHFNHKKTLSHQLFKEYLAQQKYTLKLYQELPWHLEMSGNLHDLCTIVSDPLIMDLIYQNSKHSYQSKLDLVHHWDLLSEAGFDPTVAYHKMVVEFLARPYVSENGDNEMLNYNNCRQATLIWFTAEFLKELDKTAEAKEILHIALTLLPETCPLSLKETEVYFKVHYSIGQLCVTMGKTQDAEKHFRKALHSIDYASKYIRKNLPDMVRCLAHLLFKLANLVMQGGSTDITDILQKARRITKKTCDPCTEANLKILEGFRKIHLSKLLEAENYFKQALDIRQKWYGKLHPVVAEILEPLADLLCYPKYSKSLDWSQSKKFYKEVLKIQEDSMQRARSSETRDQINLHRAITLYKLGKLLKNDGNCQARKETAERLRHSFDLLTELLGPNHHLTMEVRRLLKHVEKQICKDRTELIIDSPKISTSFLPKKYDQAESDLQCPYERLKMHHNSKILASSQADSLQMTANANSAQTTHPVDSSKEKSQADVYSDDPVVLEQDIIDDNADLEEECLTNSRSGSNLFISKHALLPRPILWMEQPKSSCPDIKSKLSTSTNKRSMPSSICKPLPTCKVPAFGPNSNTLVPSLRTKVGSERLRIIYQSAWHHPSGLHPALKKPFSSIRHVIKRNPEISWNVYRAKTPRCKAI